MFPSYISFTRFFVNNGVSIRFWKDLWWRDQSLSLVFPKLFSIAKNKEAMVLEVFSPSPIGLSWNIDFSRDLYEWEANMFGILSHMLKNVLISPSFLDKKIWVLNSSGIFSSKSMFISLLPSSTFDQVFAFGRVWRPSIPPRVKAFSWTAVWTVSTQWTICSGEGRLCSFPWIRASYAKKDQESVNHLFIHCSFSYRIWQYFLANLNFSWVMPRQLIDLFHFWRFPGVRERAKIFWGCLIHAML